MNKQAFLEALDERLGSLPDGERAKSLEYYGEMIGDRMEDGMSEEEAVAALGDMDGIVEGVMYDQSLPTLIQAKVNGGKARGAHKGWRRALILCGLPLWLPLLLGVLGVYAGVWAVIAALYAVLVALGVACAGCLIGGIVICFTKVVQVGLCIVGCGFLCGALTLLAARFVPWLTSGMIAFTGRALHGLKSVLIETEG